MKFNAVHVLEDTIRCVAAVADAADSKAREALTALPLLTYDFGEHSSREILERSWERVMTHNIQAPFPEFRYWMVQKLGTSYGVIQFANDKIEALAINVFTNKVGHQARLVIRLSMPLGMDLESAWKANFYNHETLEGIHSDQDAEFERASKWMMTNTAAMIIMLMEEYTSPANHVAKVVPNTPGKSVVWKQARSHMVIIHRHHAANSRDILPGSTVETKGHVERIAHARRAYRRYLRSSRFKNKMNTWVPVRATWVGPQEWKDTSGLTYRIVDINPVRPGAAAAR